MKILLIEPNISGHHLSLYLIPLINKILKKNFQVTIMLSKILKNNIYFNSLQKNTKIKIIFIDSYENDHRTNFLSLISKQIKYYYIFKRSFENITHKPDHIYINSFNTIDKILPLFGSPFGNTKISGFVSSIKFHLKQKNSYKSRFKRLIKSFLIFFVKGILFSRVKNLIFKIN